MKHLFVLDAFNLIYRNFFAIPPMHTKTGTPVNAVFGMTKLLISLLRDDRPDAIVVAYDSPHLSIRSQLYSEYKGTRDRMPDELKMQLPFIEELFVALGIPLIVMNGYEADDIMGSIARQCASSEWRVSLLSGDKDLYQVLSDHVRIVDGMKKIVAGEAECIAKFGVGSQYVADYLAIVGDSSDNIPGIKGFGPKKAVDLITRYGHLPEIYHHIDQLSEKFQVTLHEEKERAFLSLELATIVCDLVLPINPLSINTSHAHPLTCREFHVFLQKMEFDSLSRQLPSSLSQREETAVQEKRKSLLGEQIKKHMVCSYQDWYNMQNTMKGAHTLYLSYRIDSDMQREYIFASELVGEIYCLLGGIIESADILSYIHDLRSSHQHLIVHDLKALERRLLLDMQMLSPQQVGKLFDI